MWKLRTVQCHYMTLNLLFQRTLYTYYMLKYRHCYSIIKMFVITEIKGKIKKQYCITSIGLLNFVCRHRKKSHQHEARSIQAFGSIWKNNLMGRRVILCCFIAVGNYFLLILQAPFLEWCVCTWNVPVDMPQGTGFSGSCAILFWYLLTCTSTYYRFFSSWKKKKYILLKGKKILLQKYFKY